jgi:hypothetical protein
MERTRKLLVRSATVYDDEQSSALFAVFDRGRSTMPKGQEKKKSNNKPKLTVKEKKAKKKEKLAK